MANLKSAEKQARQNEKRRIKNLSRKTAIKTAIKKVITAIDSKVKVEEAYALLKIAESQLSRAVGKNLLHKNTVRRKISRLASQVAALEKQAG